MDSEEISPEAFHGYNCAWLGGGSKITSIVGSNHRIVSSEDPLPSERFKVDISINKCESPDYCMIGLIEKKGEILNLNESYLGEKVGILGFCFSNVSGFEKNWEWHDTQIVPGDIVSIVKTDKKIEIFGNESLRQTLTLSNTYEEIYLACHLYGECEFEILSCQPN